MALASRSLHAKANIDLTIDTRYPQGDKAQVQPASLGINLVAFNAASISFLNQPFGITVTRNFRTFLTGTSAATATLSVNAIAGALGNWAIDSIGDSLTNPASLSGSGSLQVIATDSAGNTANFPIEAWSILSQSVAGRLRDPHGIWVYLDQNIMFKNPISQTLARMDALVSLFGTNLCGFSIYPKWPQLEGPTLGNYSGDWSSDRANFPLGDDLIRIMLNKCASYSPPRYLKVINFVYTNSGDAAGSQSPTFKTFVQPAYMNNPTYGTLNTAVGLIYGQWVNCYPTSGRNEVAFPRWWSQAVHLRIRALDTHYGTTWDSHPLMGCFSSLTEYTVPTTTGYPNQNNELAMLQQLFLGPTGYFSNQRSSWKNAKCHMYFNFTSNTDNQKILVDEALKYSITIGSPDLIYKSGVPSYQWDQQVWRGINPGTKQADPTYPIRVGQGDYIGSMEPIDLDGTHGTIDQLWGIALTLGCTSLEVFDNRYAGPLATHQMPALAIKINSLMSTLPLPTAYPPLFQGA